ncbi:hypothetical protein FY137_06090 [Agrobacterium tumefaciens]|nr:hypothetical protein FY137_06090 [Agrobacterium tumefaciens]
MTNENKVWMMSDESGELYQLVTSIPGHVLAQAHFYNGAKNEVGNLTLIKEDEFRKYIFLSDLDDAVEAFVGTARHGRRINGSEADRMRQDLRSGKNVTFGDLREYLD